MYKICVWSLNDGLVVINYFGFLLVENNEIKMNGQSKNKLNKNCIIKKTPMQYLFSVTRCPQSGNQHQSTYFLWAQVFQILPPAFDWIVKGEAAQRWAHLSVTPLSHFISMLYASIDCLLLLCFSVWDLLYWYFKRPIPGHILLGFKNSLNDRFRNRRAAFIWVFYIRPEGGSLNQLSTHVARRLSNRMAVDRTLQESIGG